MDNLNLKKLPKEIVKLYIRKEYRKPIYPWYYIPGNDPVGWHEAPTGSKQGEWIWAIYNLLPADMHSITNSSFHSPKLFPSYSFYMRQAKKEYENNYTNGKGYIEDDTYGDWVPVFEWKRLPDLGRNKALERLGI